MASESYAILNRVGRESNSFYRSQFIDIAGIMGVAHAYLNNDVKVDQCLEILRSIDIAETILGPEKFMAIARIHMARKNDI